MPEFVITMPKARKEHRCSDCGRIIRSGEKYRRGAAFDGGTAWTWKDCAHCEALIMGLFGMWWEESYNEETFIEWEPDNLDGLRAKVNYLRKWTSRDGSLVEVPS